MLCTYFVDTDREMFIKTEAITHEETPSLALEVGKERRKKRRKKK